MRTLNSISILLVSTLIFGLLFHNKSLGINLVIYEVFLLGWFFATKQLTLKTNLERLMVASQIFTLAFTVINHSTWSYLIHFVVSFLLVGVMMAPTLRSLVNSLGMSFTNIFASFHVLFTPDKDSARVENKKISKRRFQFKRLGLYIIPLGIIILFATLYGFANPEFGKYVDNILGWLYDAIVEIFMAIDFWIIVTLFFGLLISIYVLMRGSNPRIIELDNAANDDKLRKKNKAARKMLGLKNENRAGIFLFASLNVLLLLMNIMDIDHVWLNFEWEGQFLRQFVHYGTIVLLVALFLSVSLVLYFFRENLNYYPKNKLLKTLCYIWLGQNIILAISAGVRNFYYIQYYSLAYKRIAIIFFLALTIYGIYSVYVKIRHTKSAFYVIRRNAVAWTIIFVVSTGFNWDRIIAEYNFSRSEDSFVHLNFIANLSDSALPAMDQPFDRIRDIDQYQEKRFFKIRRFKRGYYHDLYLTPKQYKMTIEWRKQVFKHRWEQKSWLEWNYAESKAYTELQERNAF